MSSDAAVVRGARLCLMDRDEAITVAPDDTSRSPTRVSSEDAEQLSPYPLLPVPSQITPKSTTAYPLLESSPPTPIPILLAEASHTTDTGGLRDMPGAASTASFKSPRNNSSRSSTADLIIFSVGIMVCLVIVAGAKYLRRGWRLPAPIMGASSVAFFVLKNDKEVNPKVAWMAFAIWSTATLIYVWTAKDRLPPNRVAPFIFASAAFMGILAYVFAPVLQEPTATALPLFATFSALVCKVVLQTSCTNRWLEPSSPSLPQHYVHTHLEPPDADRGYVWSSLSPV